MSLATDILGAANPGVTISTELLPSISLDANGVLDHPGTPGMLDWVAPFLKPTFTVSLAGQQVATIAPWGFATPGRLFPLLIAVPVALFLALVGLGFVIGRNTGRPA